MHHSPRVARLLTVAAACAAAAALPDSQSRAADVVSTMNTLGSSWSTASNWTNVPALGGYPSNGNAGVATYDAVIAGSEVTLNVPVTIQKLTLAGNLFLNQNITTNELFTWSGGYLAGNGTFNALGGISLSGGSRTFAFATLNTPGLAQWTAGSIFSGDGAVINNSGTFTTNFDGGIVNNQGGASLVINNSGSFVKTGGTGISSIATPFNNSGTLSANVGVILLNGGGNSSGNFVASNNATIEFDSGLYVFNNGATLTGQGTARISGAVFTVAGNASANRLDLLSGEIQGGGDLTVSRLGLVGGTVGGTGRTLLGPVSTLSIAGNVAIKARSISNSGTASWTAGTIAAGNGAVINNSGTFTTTFNGSFQYDLNGAVPVINNAGTLNKTGGTGVTTLGVVLNNSGTVIAQVGAININAGGVGSGRFHAFNGAAINFNSSYTLNSAQLIGVGFIRVTAGTTGVTGSVTATNFAIDGGTLGGGGDFAADRLDWLAGGMSGAGRTLVATGATLDINTPTSVAWSQRTISNSGTATWSGGDISAGNNAVFNNSGLLTILTDGSFAAGLGNNQASVNNTGVIRKTGGAGVTQFILTFNNSGTVSAEVGTIEIYGNGTSTGRFFASNGAGIDFPNGHTLGNGAKLEGPGVTRLTGDSLTINGTVTATNFTQNTAVNASSLTGGGDFVPQLYNWDAGTMSGTGRTLIGPAAALNINGSVTFRQRTLSNSGAASWNGATINSGDGAVFDNRGSFTVTGDGTFRINLSGPATVFNNAGVFQKTQGTGVTRIEPAFTSSGTVFAGVGRLQFAGGGAASGTFIVNSGAAVEIVGPPMHFTQAASLSGGGTLAISTNLTLDAAVNIGALNIAGAIVNTTAGTAPNVLKTQSLSITGGGNSKLNLANNAMIVDYSTDSPLPTVRAYIKSGFAGGAWNGAGISSSSAAAEPKRAIGYAEAATVFNLSGTQTASFLGKTVDATSVLMRYTVLGDTNLDSQVSFIDLLAISANFGINDGSADWSDGDTNFDGNTTFVDLLAIAANFGQALPASIPGASEEFNTALAGAAAQVPEPGVLILAPAGPMLMRRRRPAARSIA